MIELAEILLEPGPNPFWRVLKQIGVDSAVGVLEFDQKGDIKNPVYDIYIWKDGKSTPIKK